MTVTTEAEHDIVKSGGDEVRRYLLFGEREAVYQAVVTGINYDADSGSIISLEHNSSWTSPWNATLDIGTTALARDVGTVRVRTLPGSGDTVNIAETPPTELGVEVGHHITVRYEFLPWRIPKRIVVSRDGGGNINGITEYADYDSNYGWGANPHVIKPNITAGENADGSPKEVRRVRWVDGYGTGSEQNYATFTFSAQHTAVLNPGATKDFQGWLIAGTYTLVGSYTLLDETIEVQLAPGFHVIGLLVADSAGTSERMYIGVWVLNDGYPPYTDFEVTSDETEYGREMQFEFFGADDSVPDLAKYERGLVCYHEEAEFNDGAPPESYRDECYGWITDNTPTLKAEGSTYGFKMGATWTWKQQFRANSVTLIDTGATPTTYTELNHITVNRAIDWSLRAVDTLRNLVNVYYSDHAAEVEAITLPLGDGWTQIAELAPRGGLTQALCDSYGNLWLRRPYWALSTAERAGRAKALAATAADWTDATGLELPTAPVPSVGVVTAGGELWDSGDRILYASRAPSKTTDGAGKGTVKAPDQALSAAAPQDDLNRIAVLVYENQNNPRKNVTLLLAGNLDVVEPAHAEPITVTWTEDTVHGITLNQEVFLVKRVSVQHTNEPDESTPPKRVTWTLEQATTGVHGDWNTAPVLQMEGITQPTPITIYDDRIPAYTTDTAPGKVFLLSGAGGAAQRATFDPTQDDVITYTDISTGLPTSEGIWASAYPFDYRRRDALMNNGGLYREPNIWSHTTWSLVANAATIFGDSSRRGRKVFASINREGWLGITSGGNAFAFSEDDGISWQQVSFDGGTLLWGGYSDVTVSPYNSASDGVLYATRSIGGTQLRVYRSDNWGYNFTAQSTITVNGGANINIPYIRADGTTPNINDANQEVYLLVSNFSSGIQSSIYFSDDAAQTWTLMQSFTGAGVSTAPYASGTGWAIQTFTRDGSRVIAASAIATNLSGEGIRIFDNKGATDVFSSAIASTQALGLSHVNGYPIHSQFAMWWARNNGGSHLNRWYWTLDDGATVHYATLPTNFGSTNKFAAYIEPDISDLVAPA